MVQPDEPSTARRVGAVVVNHNAGAALATCVASIRAAGVNDVVVVDNASTDRSLDELAAADPGVVVVRNGANPGYGTAANAGRRRLTNEYLLICNPDLEVEREAVARLVAALDADDDVAAVGPRIVEPNGATYPSARAFPVLADAIGHAVLGPFRPDNRYSSRYKLGKIAATSPCDADWVSGACLGVRSLAFDSVGGFDERYFMYVEDLDLCWRLRRAAWRVRYEPAAAVLHLGGLSAARHPYRMLLAHHVSTWRFACKSLEGPERALLPLVALGLAFRLVVSVARAAV